VIVKGTRSAKISETNGASTMCGPSTTKTPPKVKTPSPHADGQWGPSPHLPNPKSGTERRDRIKDRRGGYHGRSKGVHNGAKLRGRFGRHGGAEPRPKERVQEAGDSQQREQHRNDAET